MVTRAAVNVDLIVARVRWAASPREHHRVTVRAANIRVMAKFTGKCGHLAVVSVRARHRPERAGRSGGIAMWARAPCSRSQRSATMVATSSRVMRNGATSFRNQGRKMLRRLASFAATTEQSELRGRLHAFADALIPDGCAFKIAAALSTVYAGTSQPAELKLHAVYSVRAGGVISADKTAGSVHDSDGFWPERWERGALCRPSPWASSSDAPSSRSPPSSWPSGARTTAPSAAARAASSMRPRRRP